MTFHWKQFKYINIYIYIKQCFINVCSLTSVWGKISFRKSDCIGMKVISAGTDNAWKDTQRKKVKVKAIS